MCKVETENYRVNKTFARDKKQSNIHKYQQFHIIIVFYLDPLWIYSTLQHYTHSQKERTPFAVFVLFKSIPQFKCFYSKQSTISHLFLFVS